MQVYVKAEQAAMEYALRNASSQTGVATPEEALRLAELDKEKVLVLYDGANLLSLSKVMSRVEGSGMAAGAGTPNLAYLIGRGGLQYVGGRETALMELSRLSYPVRAALLARTVYREHLEGQARPLTVEMVAATLAERGLELKYGFDDHLGYWAQAGTESSNRCESTLEAAFIVCRELHVEVG